MKKILLFILCATLLVGCTQKVPVSEVLTNYEDESTVYMPKITLSNQALSSQINQQIESTLKDNYKKIKGNTNGTTMEGFSAFINGDLLSIFHEGYYQAEDNFDSVSYLITFHINTKNGTFYKLDDLFKDNYIEELTNMVDSQLENTLKEYYIASSIDLRNTNFDVFDNNLIFIFDPFSVTGDQLGFVDIVIPFSDIENILNKDGEFYSILKKD